VAVQAQRLFNGIGDGKEKPDYDAIAKELVRLRQVNNNFFSTYIEKEDALADVGKIAQGLFNRAVLLDGGNPDDYD
jgi:hypothetical protein